MSRRCMITLQSSTPSPLLKNMSKKWWALFFWEGFNFLVEKGVTIIEQPFDHVAINPLSNSTHNQDLNRFQLSIENITVRSQLRHKTILETCDIWDTDSNSDNWEPEFMTMTVNSICNCDVLKTFACSFCKGFPCEGRTLCTRLPITQFAQREQLTLSSTHFETNKSQDTICVLAFVRCFCCSFVVRFSFRVMRSHDLVNVFFYQKCTAFCNSIFPKVYLKGLFTIFYFRSELIFWIVMGCGIADFGRRAL